MCDCAEERERRRREAGGIRKGQGAPRSNGQGAPRSNGGPGSEDSTGILIARIALGGTAFIVGALSLLHKYLNIFGPLLEKYGFRPKKQKLEKTKLLDPDRPDPKCDCGIRINPDKRKWPTEKEC